MIYHHTRISKRICPGNLLEPPGISIKTSKRLSEVIFPKFWWIVCIKILELWLEVSFLRCVNSCDFTYEKIYTKSPSGPIFPIGIPKISYQCFKKNCHIILHFFISGGYLKTVVKLNPREWMGTGIPASMLTPGVEVGIFIHWTVHWDALNTQMQPQVLHIPPLCKSDCHLHCFHCQRRPVWLKHKKPRPAREWI